MTKWSNTILFFALSTILSSTVALQMERGKESVVRERKRKRMNKGRERERERESVREREREKERERLNYFGKGKFFIWVIKLTCAIIFHKHF